VTGGLAAGVFVTGRLVVGGLVVGAAVVPAVTVVTVAGDDDEGEALDLFGALDLCGGELGKEVEFGLPDVSSTLSFLPEAPSTIRTRTMAATTSPAIVSFVRLLFRELTGAGVAPGAAGRGGETNATYSVQLSPSQYLSRPGLAGSSCQPAGMDVDGVGAVGSFMATGDTIPSVIGASSRDTSPPSLTQTVGSPWVWCRN
jgi:hypothetical protein